MLNKITERSKLVEKRIERRELNLKVILRFSIQFGTNRYKCMNVLETITCYQTKSEPEILKYSHSLITFISLSQIDHYTNCWHTTFLLQLPTPILEFHAVHTAA